jgi:hypothetical protein
MLAVGLHQIPALVQERLVEAHSRQAGKIGSGQKSQHRLLARESAP